MTAQTGITTPETLDPAAAASPQTVAAGTPASMLDESAVVAYLQAHPHFFHQHADLLLTLSIPHPSGKAVSLLERQVAVYRERQGDMEEQFHEIIGNARENDSLFEVTRMVILDLLHCTNMTELNLAIQIKLNADFAASASRLVFVSDHDFPKEAHMKCLPSSAVRTALGELYQKQRTWCGPLNTVQQDLLFSDHHETIVSAAIVPLHLPEGSPIRTRYGLPLLLIGSVELQHFNSSLDTLFLDFIGEVLAVHIHNLAKLA